MAVHFFSGAGVGLFLGMLLGLSSSPVVGLVVGALAALLAPLIDARLGDKLAPATPNEPLTPTQRKASSIRAGAFGFACVAGLVCGIYVRTHDSLSPDLPTLKQRVEELKGVGFTDAEARRLAVLRTLDADAKSPQAPETTKAADDLAKLRSSILLTGLGERCERIRPDRYKDLNAAIEAYRAMDERTMLGIATGLNQRVTGETQKMGVLQMIVEVACTNR